ncbi:HD domain-containing phosphohydrolase [Candidatus Omnitrophota bacterium]
MSIKNYSILMSEFNKREKMKFLLKFYESGSIQLFKDVFLQIMGKATQCLVCDSEYRPVRSKERHSQHISNLPKGIKKSRSKKTHVFNCCCNKPCLFMPIVQGDNIYGYIIMLHLRRKIDEEHLMFLKLFMDIALKEFQKEQELTKLYDTIRPRAIALSTIHTIHRLLSSTLDMDELIERIARLTLQVMRSRHCSIMLLDDSKKYLIPKARIDAKNNNSNKMQKRHRKIGIGDKTIGKVARTGKTILSHNLICVPLIEEDILGVICAKNKTNNTPFNKFDLEILLTLAEQAVIAIRNAQLYEEQDRMTYGSIKSLAAILDAKSPKTYTHSEEFVEIVLAIAEEMRLPREEIRNLRYAALLPDTGKFSIPDEILKKRGGLSRKEYNIIKRQHLESLKILEPLEFLKPTIPIIVHHHERYDGTGYPGGLKGKKIPIGARIMAVADAFEAMLSLRPYKANKTSIKQVLREIKNNKGTQFDPDVVDAFMTVSKKHKFKGLF